MSDADDFQQLPETAGPLFGVVEDAHGPFANSKVAPEAIERVVANMIWRHQGRANPISIAKLSAATGQDARAIKGIVEQLVTTHRVMIGGKRGEPVGYFVVVDSEDLETAVRPYRDQIFAMWRRLRVLLGRKALAELHGQLTIEEQGQESQ